MEEARPSKTALRVALRRAAHQVYDPEPRVFDDPIALAMLQAEYGDELKKTATKLNKAHSVALRAFLVARSRFAEDKLLAAYESGVRQYCLLGAGLDTFGLRNSWPDLRVYEVDHPATQAWKRELLRRAKLEIPESVGLVPIDFERQALGPELQAAGFDLNAPAFFAWLGVVPYLTHAAFRSTVDFVGARPRRSGLVLDYALPREVLPPLEQLAHDSLASRVALAGEPFQLFFTRDAISKELSSFDHVEHLGAKELNALYFTDRQDLLRVRGSAGRVLCAWK